MPELFSENKCPVAVDGGCREWDGPGKVAVMMEPFVGSEAVAAGELTKSQLATRCQRLFPDVYLARAMGVDAAVRAKAGWLWSGRRGVVAGFAAAALHGSRWADDVHVVELIHDNWRNPAGIQTRGDRIEDDEIELIAGIPVTSPARTALSSPAIT